MKIKTLLTVFFLSSVLMSLAQAQEQLSNDEAKLAIQSPSPVPEMTFSSKRLAKKLMKATLEGDHAKMKDLLDKGADINLPVKGKYSHDTPLGECFSSPTNCSEETINLLLEHGADVRKLRAEEFESGSEWKPKDVIITRAITVNIDRGNHSRFKFLMDKFPDQALSSVEHMKLYGCYGTQGAGFLIGRDCGYKKSKWPNDLKKARWHLEKAVELFDGKTHDGRLYGSSDPRYMLATEIKNALSTWGKQFNYQEAKASWPIAEAVPYCERAVEWLKPDAEKENDHDCRYPHTWTYCDDGSGKKFGTGSGYLNIRTLLNHCLYYTKDHEQWERLLKTRMDYFSLRSDVQGQKSWLLSHAEYRYKKNNDINTAREFASMRSEAVEAAAILKKNNWDPQVKFYAEKAHRWLAAQEQKERDDAIAGERRWKEMQAEEAADRREARARDQRDWADKNPYKLNASDQQFMNALGENSRRIEVMYNQAENSNRTQNSQNRQPATLNDQTPSVSSSTQNNQQKHNSAVNGQANTAKKEQCPLKPLGKFDPDAPVLSDLEMKERAKAFHKKWRDSLSPYCKSLTPKAEDLFKSVPGSGVSK